MDINITQWLQQNGFGEYTELFKENEITIEDLAEIATHDDLKEVGIESDVHRKKIITAIIRKVAQSDMASSGSVLDEQEQLIINTYPYLIAYPFQEMLAEKDPFKRISLLKDVSENVVKFLALLVATEYFSSNKQSREINDLFRDKISRPSFGSWNHFLRDSIKYLINEKYSFFIPELIEFYRNVEIGGGKKKVIKRKIRLQYTDENDELKYATVSETYIGHLINFRNTYLGHGKTPHDDESRDIFNEYYPLLKSLLTEMSFCKDYQMIKYDNGQLFILMGSAVKELEGNTKKFIEDERVWLQNPKGEKMPLIPFFIVPKEYIVGAAKDIELYVYDQFPGNRILFFSPNSRRDVSMGKIVKKLQLLIENKRKETPLSINTLTEEILKGQINYVSNRFIKSLINERKVIKGIYQQRLDAEISLKSWVKGQASVYFLASEAGGGKTNLLNEMNRQYLESGFETLFLRANRFSSDNFTLQLKHELNLAGNFAFEKFSFFQRKQDNPFLILIDGLNESNNPLEFLSSIKTFLSKLAGGGIKIIVSWRVNTLKALPELDDSWDTFLYGASDDNSENDKLLAKKAYWLKRMSKLELEGAWDRYTSQKDFKLNFSLKDLTYKDRLLANQLSNPLLLRMFLELFSGKTLKALPDDTLNIWKLWYKDISRTSGTDELLLALSTLMLEKENAVLPLDPLYDDPILSDYVHDTQINSPFQYLIKKGILSQYFIDNEIVVSFAMEALFHYCLSLSLQKNEKYNDVDELLKLTKTNKLSGVNEAVKYMLWDDIRNKEYTRLNYFIARGIKYREITSFPLAQAFILYDIDEVLHNILLESNKNEWQTLRWAITELEDAQEQLIKKDLLIKIQPYVNVNSLVECLLLLDAVKFINIEDRNELLDKITSHIPTLENIKESDKGYTFSSIGNVYSNQGDFEKALEYHLMSLAIRKKAHGKEHPSTAISYDNIGTAYTNQGDYEKALKYYLQALTVKEKVLGKEHPSTVMSYNNIGVVYRKKGNYEKSLEYQQRSLLIREKIHGKEHPSTAESYDNIGVVYDDKGDYDKALEHHLKSLTIIEKIYGKEHTSTARSYNNIGNVYDDKGNYEKSLEYYLMTLEIYKKVHGKEHPSTAMSYNNIGIVYLHKGDYEKALKYYLKSLAIYEKVHGKEHSSTADSYNNIGLVYDNKGDYEKALEYQQRSLTIREKVHGKEHPSTAMSYNNIGLVYTNQGDYEKALEFHLRSLAIKEKVYGKEHPDTASSNNNIGNVYYIKGDYEKALKYYLISLAIDEKVLGKEHPDTANSYNNIGSVYGDQGDYEKALEYFLKALTLRTKLFGENHEDVKAVKKMVADCYKAINEKTSTTIGEEPPQGFVGDQFEEDETSTTKSVQEPLHSLKRFFLKFLISLLISIIAIVFIIFLFPLQNFTIPKFAYDSEWFVTAKSGYLMWNSTDEEDGTQKFKKKTSLTPGIQLKPIAVQNNYWIQAETPRGQRGFVHYSLLEGAKYVEANNNVVVYKKIGDTIGETITIGTKGVIIKHNTKTIEDSVYQFIKVKFEDESRWAVDNDFDKLIISNMPRINQEYYYPTSIDIVKQNIIGKPLDEIEYHYGNSTSYIKDLDKNQAYFGNLIIVDQKKHYKGIIVNLTKQDAAVSFKYVGKAESRFYDKLPLINIVRELERQSLYYSNSNLVQYIKDKKLEPSRLVSFLLYHTDNSLFGWWDNFINKNWFTKFIGWFVLFNILYLIFSIPYIIVAPIKLLLLRFNLFGVRFFKSFNFLIHFIIAYFFLLVMVIVMDQLIIPLIATLFVPYSRWTFNIAKRGKYFNKMSLNKTDLVASVSENTVSVSNLSYEEIDMGNDEQNIAANIQNGEENYENENYEVAISYYKAALKIQLALYGEKYKDVANSYNKIGNCYYWKEDYIKAIVNHHQALNIRIKIFGEENKDVAESYHRLGKDYYWAKQYPTAIQMHTKALNIRVILFGENAESVVNSYNEIGNCYYWKEDYIKAIVNHHQALNIRIKIFGEENKDVAESYHRLGKDYYWAEQYPTAIQIHTKALNIRKILFGEYSEEFDNSTVALGRAFYYEGSKQEAFNYFKISLRFRKKYYGESSDEYNEVKEWM